MITDRKQNCSQRINYFVALLKPTTGIRVECASLVDFNVGSVSLDPQYGLSFRLQLVD